MEPKRAAGYLRVSTTSQAEKGESLATQRSQIEAYCAHNGLSLVGFYSDEGISGKDQDRPELLRLLTDVTMNKFDMVVVTRLSRFGRSTRDLINNLGTLDDNKILFASLKEQFDTSTPAGRLLRTMLIAIAEFEHEVIFSQMAENRQVRWSRGDIKIGQSPYGYTWNKEKKTFEIHPDEAAIYHKMKDWYLAGESYTRIAEKLKAMEVKFKWAYPCASTVGTILNNKCYTGTYTVNRRQFKGKVKTGGLKPVEENITITLPPLISMVDYQKLQDKIKFNRIITKRTTHPEFWLRNVLVCEECGAIVKPRKGRLSKKTGEMKSYYTCYWTAASMATLKAHGKTDKCKLPYIRTDDLEDRVMYYLINFLTFGGYKLHGEYHPPEIEALITPEKYDDQILALTSQLINFKRVLGRKQIARTNLFEMMEMPGFDKNEFLTQRAKLMDEIHSLLSQMEDTQTRLSTLEQLRDNNEELVSFVRGNTEWLKNVGSQILALSPPDKQRLVEAMVVGKIPVSFETEKSRVQHWDINPRFAFNFSVLQSLSDEGKLNRVNPG